MQSSQTEPVGRRYRIIDEIGVGGMGTVFRAEDLLSGEVVALKRVNTAVVHSGARVTSTGMNFRVAMAQEFKTLASLRHPHIIAVRDYGFDEAGQPYFTMDFIENARTILDAGRKRNFKTQISYLAQVLQALAYLHRRHIIHRDLKPANVLVDENDVKLLDFGLSKMKQQDQPGDGLISGTIAYMAPELFYEGEASESSDIYALGVIAYELLAGHHPFDVDNVNTLVSQILTDYPDLSEIDSTYPIVRMIGNMLEKDPKKRISSAVEALYELNAATGENYPLETEAIRESFLQTARIIGRDEEISTLSMAFQRAADGRGAAYLVGGESGVGKSRLVDEIRVRSLVRGAFVLRGQAISEAGGLYQIWQLVLRWLELLSDQKTPTLARILPGASDDGHDTRMPSPEVVQSRLLSMVIDTLKTIDQPVVMVFEDIHWAGSDSLSLLDKLSRRLKDLPLLVLATYRNDEMPHLPEQLPHMEHMVLSRLSEDDVAKLSEEMLGDVGKRPQVLDLIQREAEGNVFFLIEVVRLLAQEAGNLQNIGLATLPDQVFAGGIQRIILRRLEQVPVKARDLLYVAAAYGRRIDLDILRAVAPDMDMSWWLLVCSEAAVLEVGDEEWRFSHDRIRDGILTQIPEETQKALHYQLALAIEQVYSDALDHMLALAYHWHLAGELEKEEYYSVKAARLSVLSGAYHEAIGYMQRALELNQMAHISSDNVQKQLDYKRVLASAYLGLGEYDKAESLYRENLARNMALNDAEGIALSLENLGSVLIVLERTDEAQSTFEQSLGRYRDLEDREGMVRVLNQLGNVAYEMGDQDKANAFFQESLDISREIGGAWGKAGVVAKKAEELSPEAVENYNARREQLLVDLSVARKDADHERMASVLQELGQTEQEIGNYPEALRYFNLALASFEAQNNTLRVVDVQLQLGELANQIEQYDDALHAYLSAFKWALENGMIGEALHVLIGCAQTLMNQARYDMAINLLAHVLHNPQTLEQSQDFAESILFALEEKVDPEVMAESWDTGKALSLEDIRKMMLGEA